MCIRDRSTGELFGSTATILTSGLWSLNPSPVPVQVPPVPTDEMCIRDRLGSVKDRVAAAMIEQGIKDENEEEGFYMPVQLSLIHI